MSTETVQTRVVYRDLFLVKAIPDLLNSRGMEECKNAMLNL